MSSKHKDWKPKEKKLNLKPKKRRSTSGSRSDLPPRKRNWTPGSYQTAVFVRTPNGSTLETVKDKSTEAEAFKLLVACGLRNEKSESQMIVDWLRAKYRHNKHAIEWADAIEEGEWREKVYDPSAADPGFGPAPAEDGLDEDIAAEHEEETEFESTSKELPEGYVELDGVMMTEEAARDVKLQQGYEKMVENESEEDEEDDGFAEAAANEGARIAVESREEAEADDGE